MTVINTNVKSLVAQDAIQKNNRTLSTAMERLSTGKRINSAKDDAAGLAISTRMEAQTRGLNMAIRNANDGISLLQTAEGATDEVTNILQRMRELAVQSVNGTNNAQDRAALNDEVQQLKTEIDRIASTTQFNNINILDGSFKDKKFQIGDKADQTVGLSIASMKTKDLGMSPNAFGGDMLVSSRISPAAVDAGDIQINGQALGAIKALDDMEDIVKNINDHVDNVVASGFNVVTAKNVGNGITATGEFQIKVQALGSTSAQATTFNITASNSMDELIANINAESSGLVKASKDDTGRLVLSNDTGATIMVNDQSGSAANAYDGGSGFVDGGASNTFSATKGTFRGFLKLESKDGSPIRVERGNYGQTNPGTLDDLAAIGYREVSSEPVKENYTATGLNLTASGVSGSWNKTDVKINGVEIWSPDVATDSFQGKLNAINNFTEQTGVSASAYFEKTFDMSGVVFPNDQSVSINGKQIQLGANLSAFATNINAATAQTGLVATVSGNNMTLSGANVQSVAIGHVDPNITTRLTSTVSAMGDSADARTITIASADVVAGRTIQLVARGDGGTAASFAASYTIKTGDTKTSVATALRNAILATASQVNGQTGYGGGRSAAALTASGAVLTFAAGSSTYGNVEIELRTTMARYDDISIVQSKVSNPGADSSAAVTITLSAADMVAGRTVQLSFTQGVTSSNQVGKDFTVSYTIQTGDTVTNVASALVAAIQNTASGMYAGRGSGFSGTSAEVSNAAGVITIAAAALYGTAYGELSFIKPALGTADTYYGAIRLDSVNNQPITIELGDSANVNEHGLLEMNVGAADYEVNAPSMGSSSGQAVSGLGVSSQSAATKAISVIDNALETVNKSRSYLGAMQNRLTNTINNLDNIVTNTEASKSRILDTDYAKETTELARSQIIAQAATAMLAQANQAPQSVLALLK